MTANPESIRAIQEWLDLVNRHYVMTCILERRQFSDYVKLAVLQWFGIASSLVSVKGWLYLPAVLRGKVSAIREIISSKYGTAGDKS